MNIVERIRQKCCEEGTNIANIEKELNIGNGVIRRWNERKAGAEQVYKIAIRLNTSVEWLLTGKESKDLTPEEQKLVDTYRNCNPVGQQLIQDHAEAIHKQLPADHHADEAGVSISETG